MSGFIHDVKGVPESLLQDRCKNVYFYYRHGLVDATFFNTWCAEVSEVVHDTSDVPVPQDVILGVATGKYRLDGGYIYRTSDKEPYWFTVDDEGVTYFFDGRQFWNGIAWEDNITGFGI